MSRNHGFLSYFLGSFTLLGKTQNETSAESPERLASPSGSSADMGRDLKGSADTRSEEVR